MPPPAVAPGRRDWPSGRRSAPAQMSDSRVAPWMVAPVWRRTERSAEGGRPVMTRAVVGYQKRRIGN